MLLFKQCWEVNSYVLTFLEVGFGGNLLQGFRVYAWRAVPSFPQIAQCFPSLALRPQPFNILSGAMRAGNISTYYLPNWNYFKGSSTMRRLPLPQGVGHSIYLQSYNWQPSSRLEIGTGVWVWNFCQFFSQESCRRNIQWSSLRYIQPPHSHP